MEEHSGQETNSDRWGKPPEPFRLLTCRDLVECLARTLDRDETVQALELATSFCAMAADWAETRPSTSLVSYRAALLATDPESSRRLASFLDSEELTATEMSLSALIAVRWLSTAIERDIYPSSRLWNVTVEALFVLLADNKTSNGVH